MTQEIIGRAPHPAPPARRTLAVFGYGFRPFFLLAGLDAIANMAVWLCVYFKPDIWPEGAIAPMYWHAHEMIFGFIAAAIAGFLLTAVPGWTGQSSYAGKPLIGLSVLWLCGRLVMLPVSHAPGWLVAAIDLSFFPALAVTLAPSLIRARKFRNLPFLLILAILFLANLSFHLGALGVVPAGEHISFGIAADIIALLVTIIGGRIIPAFTRSGLIRHGIKVAPLANPMIDMAAIASMVAVLIADILIPLSPLNGAVAGIAAILQAIRLSQWEGHRSWRDPLTWVLHVGYAWLVVGLALKALWYLTAMPVSEKWIHAFTIGCFATLILAVMSRASLGHTGRALIAPAPMTAAYLLVSAAALIRVFAPALLPTHYQAIVAVAGVLWILAFGIFSAVYAPILVRARADGRPG